MSKERKDRPRVEPVVFALALLGILVAIHLWIQEGRGFDRGCSGFLLPESIEAAFDCSVVVNSDAGRFLGVTNALWGLLFYLTTGALTVLHAVSGVHTARRARAVRSLFVLFGAAYTTYLVYYQRLVLHQYCALCLTSAVLVTLLLVVHAYSWIEFRKRRPIMTNPTLSLRQVRLYAALSVLTLVLAGADVAYFSRAEVPDGLTTQVAPTRRDNDCHYAPDRQPIENHMHLISMGDPVVGNPDAKVTVIEVYEPNCGHCRTLLPIMKEIVQEYGDRARFYLVPVMFYPQPSYLQSAALFAAMDAGRYFEMLDEQFARQRQGGLSLEQLTAIADEIGMDGDKMAEQIRTDVYRERILAQRRKVVEDFQIRSVPTVIINGRIVATKSRDCIGRLIEEAAK